MTGSFSLRIRIYHRLLVRSLPRVEPPSKADEEAVRSTFSRQEKDAVKLPVVVVPALSFRSIGEDTLIIDEIVTEEIFL